MNQIRGNLGFSSLYICMSNSVVRWKTVFTCGSFVKSVVAEKRFKWKENFSEWQLAQNFLFLSDKLGYEVGIP